MKILFVASEALPYSKTGGLADVVKRCRKPWRRSAMKLPSFCRAIAAIKSPPQLISSLTIPLGDTLRFPALAEGSSVAGVRYYFLDDPEFFDREDLYGDKSGEYRDNAERYRRGFPRRDRIHEARLAAGRDALSRLANGVGPGPSAHAIFKRSECPLDSRGIHDPQRRPTKDCSRRSAMRRIGLPQELFTIDGLEFFGNVNFLKGGILHADYLTTVSRRYAKEIQTPEFGGVLDGVIRSRADRLVGILNGADYSIWSPGGRYPHRAELFLAQSRRQESVQEKSARGIWTAGREYGSAADRHRFAIRGSERLRPDC